MSVGIGQLLKLLDMTPDKKGKRTFIEKFPSAQKLDGGDLSKLMGMMQAGGLTSLFKNPLAAVSGPLQQLTAAVGSAQGGAGANAFAAAVAGSGGLSDAVQSIAGAAARITGTVIPGAGQYGLMDLATHESVLSQFGSAAPASAALAIAAAPPQASDLLLRVADTLNRTNISVLNNQIAPADAAQTINGFTGQINAIVNASNAALAWGESMAPSIAQVHAAAGSLVSGSPELQNLVRSWLQPDAAAAMDAAMTDRLTIRPPDDASASQPSPTTGSN